MPLFNDLKKLFFGAKSVAKHQAEKAGEAASGAVDDLREKGPEYIDKGKDALTDLGDKLWKEADALADKGREFADEASQKINSKLSELGGETEKAKTIIEEEVDFGQLDLTPEKEAPKSGSINFEDDLVADNPPPAPSAWKEAANEGLDTAAQAGNELAKKLGKLSEAVGKEVLDKGGKLADRAAAAGAVAREKVDDFVDHANREAEKMKLEDSIEEAERAAEQAEARARAFDGKEAARDTSDSILDGTDSFFDRAARYAEGDYSNEGGKDVRILDERHTLDPKPEGGLIAGFLDSDGDGDSLIDDAVIEEE